MSSESERGDWRQSDRRRQDARMGGICGRPAGREPTTNM